MMNLTSANRFEYAYHVEADVRDVRVLRKVGFGQRPDRRLFTRRYGLQRISILRAPTQLYLNEGQGLGSRIQIMFYALLTNGGEKLELRAAQAIFGTGSIAW